MKKIALLLLVIACFSCEKQETKEWSKFFGYTNDDIVGEYVHSGLSTAFADLPESSSAYLCADAQVKITSTSETGILFRIDCPDHNFAKSFSGCPSPNSGSFLINMGGAMSGMKRYVLSATVRKNGEEKVRLEGSVSEDHFVREYNTATQKYDTIFDHSVKYYFDVIKN